ncbi:MAG: hypothetical protein NTY20_04845 [Candidatus Aenigmarchaeota archaeon]|nr:hypothetical protein [Candidatus Aenigmarchaeota archaeon]
MEIRQAFEKRFGEEKVHQVFDNPNSELRYGIPMARVVTVRGRNWQVDYTPRVDFTNGEELELFLEYIEKLYEKRFNRKLKIEPGEAVGASWGFVMLGTRSKVIKDYLKNYGGG